MRLVKNILIVALLLIIAVLSLPVLGLYLLTGYLELWITALITWLANQVKTNDSAS